MLLCFCAFCKRYTNEHVFLKCTCHRHSHSSHECFKNISVMNINVNNEFKSCAAGTMGGKTRTLIFVSISNAQFWSLKHRCDDVSSPIFAQILCWELVFTVQHAECSLNSRFQTSMIVSQSLISQDFRKIFAEATETIGNKGNHIWCKRNL